ncbi:hypothetical protein L596_021345 [Steinernema carpocapsae]|uniref:Uncharacterized protein n=1 Tax=Steinernema carpocapsae TaxID=34508 RepID=A0A4U5MIF2_STECR|nr:hypothetical protein L596_021345 [Steinernema carpocapsae]
MSGWLIFLFFLVAAVLAICGFLVEKARRYKLKQEIRAQLQEEEDKPDEPNLFIIYPQDSMEEIRVEPDATSIHIPMTTDTS